MAAVTLQRKSLNTVAQDQKKLITQAGLERKTEQFNTLKSWEVYREGLLTHHRKILENVFERMDKRVQVSEHSMSRIIAFYQQRTEFEENCSKFYRD
jgi:hypothetical protein